jgi:hypothetical protein
MANEKNGKGVYAGCLEGALVAVPRCAGQFRQGRATGAKLQYRFEMLNRQSGGLGIPLPARPYNFAMTDPKAIAAQWQKIDAAYQQGAPTVNVEGKSVPTSTFVGGDGSHNSALAIAMSPSASADIALKAAQQNETEARVGVLAAQDEARIREMAPGPQQAQAAMEHRQRFPFDTGFQVPAASGSTSGPANQPPTRNGTNPAMAPANAGPLIGAFSGPLSSWRASQGLSGAQISDGVYHVPKNGVPDYQVRDLVYRPGEPGSDPRAVLLAGRYLNGVNNGTVPVARRNAGSGVPMGSNGIALAGNSRPGQGVAMPSMVGNGGVDGSVWSPPNFGSNQSYGITGPAPQLTAAHPYDNRPLHTQARSMRRPQPTARGGATSGRGVAAQTPSPLLHQGDVPGTPLANDAVLHNGYDSNDPRTIPGYARSFGTMTDMSRVTALMAVA